MVCGRDNSSIGIYIGVQAGNYGGRNEGDATCTCPNHRYIPWHEKHKSLRKVTIKLLLTI